MNSLLAAARRAPRQSTLRLYSTEPVKPSVKLVAELRKRTEVSLSKAREALAATQNDVDAALAWLDKDLAISGAKKAEKVAGRAVGEGLVSVSVLARGTGSGGGQSGVRAAMVELNCETDFVARNQLFGALAANIAHTAAFLSEQSGALLAPCPLDVLHDAPLLSAAGSSSSSQATVANAIRDTIAKVGENISLRRALAVARDPLPPTSELGLRIASYLHGSVNNPSQGRIGALALVGLKSPRILELLASEGYRGDLEKLERALGRQIVGFDTRSVKSVPGAPRETALYEQQFMMLGTDTGGDTVKVVLQKWAEEKGMVEAGSDSTGGVEVLELAKWTVGETLDS